MRRPLLFLPLARFHAPYEPVDKFRQSKAGWRPWATARDAVRNIFLAFSALNPLKNQTLSQHRIQRDGRPNELGYGGDVFWFNAMRTFLSSIQDLGSSIASYLARVRRRFSNRGSPWSWSHSNLFAGFRGAARLGRSTIGGTIFAQLSELAARAIGFDRLLN